MRSKEIAQRVFLSLGAEPDALEDKEPSAGVWLLAARFAWDYEQSSGREEWYRGWPGFFAAPENRPRQPSMFTGCLVHDTESDRRVLRVWLAYARERIKRLERRLLIDLLAESLANKATRQKVQEAAG